MRLGRIARAGALPALIAASAIALVPPALRAQDEGSGMGPAGGGAMGSASGAGTENDRGMGMNPSTPADDSSMPPPMAKMNIRQQITGSMMVAPPYGSAPLKVGFFVLADDPEGLGFLTYSWNFGDGTVSALPPELYIFHTYTNPGSYLCSLTIKTVDGRSQTFMQGVVVKAVGD